MPRGIGLELALVPLFANGEVKCAGHDQDSSDCIWMPMRHDLRARQKFNAVDVQTGLRRVPEQGYVGPGSRSECLARTKELSQSVGELRALGEVSQAVNSTLDLQSVLDTIVTRATQLKILAAGAPRQRHLRHRPCIADIQAGQRPRLSSQARSSLPGCSTSNAAKCRWA